MTVVAAYRGPKNSLNAMLVDTICSPKHDPAATLCWVEKLTWVYGNTYVTAIGDSDVLLAVRTVVDYLNPKRPNFRDPRTIDAIFGAVERIWTVRIATAAAQGQTVTRHGSKGSLIFVCNRNEVFFWVCGFDMATMKFHAAKAPHEVPEGKLVVLWGSHRSTINDLDAKLHEMIRANPFHMLAAAIAAADKENREAGLDHLAYQLDGRFSGIVLPHKPSIEPARLHPFGSFPEMLVRESGPALLPLLDDPEFMNYKLPSGS